MKKVFAVLMAVFMMVLAVNAMADETVKGGNASEVYGWTIEWCMSQGIYDQYDGKLEDGVYYTVGVIDMEYFKEVTGHDTWSMEDLKDVYLSDICPYDVEEVNVQVIGFYEGYSVYRMDIKANTVIGVSNENEYYNGSIIFMVCE